MATDAPQLCDGFPFKELYTPLPFFTPFGVCQLTVAWVVFAGRVFNGSGKAVDKGPQVLAEDYLDIQGLKYIHTWLFALPVRSTLTLFVEEQVNLLLQKQR